MEVIPQQIKIEHAATVTSSFSTTSSSTPSSIIATTPNPSFTLGILAQISSNSLPISVSSNATSQPASHLTSQQSVPTPSPQYSSKDLHLQKQEVRTKRYITVTLEGLDLGKKKMLLSWYEGGNGIPDSCFLLVPQRQSNVILSLKNTQGKGWVEVDTSKACFPEFKVEFQIRIDFADADQKVDDATLQFILKDKDGENVKEIGESIIVVTLKCTKNKSDSLRGQMREIAESQQ